ncbi:MAG: hypothetical protein Q9226_005236 [Calogaya cf. arnoldii]
MSSLRLSFLGLLAVFGLASAQSSVVNASDISIWPPCAQRCIPLGLAPPVNCGSLSNIECICNRPDFLLAIADCERSTCTTPETAAIGELSKILCAPFGGLGPSASSFAQSFLATYTNTLPSTPIIVGTPTAPPTANASEIAIYPQRKQQSCMDQAVAAQICPNNDLACACGPENRAFFAACNARQCNVDERQAINALARKLCGPLYISDPALSGSVQSAIAIATKGVAVSASASASESINSAGAAGPTGVQGAAGGTSGSSNGSTNAGGMNPPAPFTGAAGRLGGENLAVVVSAIVGAVGVVVMVRL